MEVEWIAPDSALVRERDYTATLHFHVSSASWYVTVPVDACGDQDIEVDYDQRIAFTREREEIAQLMESVRDPLIAELEGRIQMFRDETKDLAVMGAKIALRKAIRNL